MSRTIAITGAASGMGQAAAELAEQRGWRVVRIDLRSGDVQADLATDAGRRLMVAQVQELTGGRLDAVVACAGVSPPPGFPPATPEMIVRVNFFGAIATLEGLRPLLARGSAARAVVVSSYAAIDSGIPLSLVDACMAHDESLAIELAGAAGLMTYGATKAGVVRWVRRHCLTPQWLGQGILLNAIAPAHVETPMIKPLMEDPEIMEAMRKLVPSPMGRPARAGEIAELLLWLTSPQNSVVVGQVIFCDGGAEALTRGEGRW